LGYANRGILDKLVLVAARISLKRRAKRSFGRDVN